MAKEKLIERIIHLAPKFQAEVEKFVDELEARGSVTSKESDQVSFFQWAKANTIDDEILPIDYARNIDQYLYFGKKANEQSSS